MRYSLTDCILCTSGAHTECAMHDAMCQMRPRSALFVLFRIFILFFCCTHLLCYEYICSTIEISIPLNVVALHRFPVTRRILFMDNTKALLKPSIMREQHYHCAGRWYWYTKPSYQPKVYTFINICRQFSDFQSIEWLCVCARILNVRYRKCCNFLFQSEKKNVFVGPQHTLNVDNKFLEEEYWMTTPSEGNTEHIRRHKHEQTGKKKSLNELVSNLPGTRPFNNIKYHFPKLFEYWSVCDIRSASVAKTPKLLQITSTGQWKMHI